MSEHLDQKPRGSKCDAHLHCRGTAAMLSCCTQVPFPANPGSFHITLPFHTLAPCTKLLCPGTRMAGCSHHVATALREQGRAGRCDLSVTAVAGQWMAKCGVWGWLKGRVHTLGDGGLSPGPSLSRSETVGSLHWSGQRVHWTQLRWSCCVWMAAHALEHPPPTRTIATRW